MMTPGEGGGEQAPQPQIITPDKVNDRAPQPGETLTIVEKYNTREVPISPEGDLEKPVEGADNEIQKETDDQTEDTLKAQERAQTKQEIAESTREQRDANIEKLITELPDFIKNATSLAEAKEEYKKLLKEQGATDARIEGELARMDSLADRVEDMAESSLDDMVNDGSLTAEQAEEKKSKIRQFMESGLVTLGEFAKEGMDASDFGTIMNLFLVFGIENGGGKNISNLESMKGTEADDYLLSEIRKNPVYLVAALEKAFGSNGLYEDISRFEPGKIGNDMDKLAKLIAYFNNRAKQSEDNWTKLSTGMIDFIDPSGQKGYQLSEKVKLIFEQLDSPDALRSFMGIDTDDTSKKSDDTSDESTKTQGNTTPIPDNPQNTVPEPKAA